MKSSKFSKILTNIFLLNQKESLENDIVPRTYVHLSTEDYDEDALAKTLQKS